MIGEPVLSARILLPLLAALVLTAPPSRAVDKSLVESGRRATAYVYVEFEKGSASGSAFCIDSSGLFVTCHHVVSGNGGPVKVTLTVSPGTPAARTLPATIVASHAGWDLAILRVDKPGLLNTVELAPPALMARLNETTPIMALGFPYGENFSIGKALPEISISTGKITALRHDANILAVVQFDGSINPGNSGGPVLDDRGNVIGIVQAIIPNKQINFAVPATFAQALLAQSNIVLTPKILTDPKAGTRLARLLAADPSANRAAVPDAATLKASRKVVQDLLAAQFSDKSPKGRFQLSLDLLDRAEATKDDPPGRYALLTESREAAMAAGDLATAFYASALIFEGYDVKTFALMEETVIRLAPRQTKPQDAAVAAATALLLVEAMAGREEFDAARKLIPLVRSSAAECRNPTVVSQVRDRLQRIETEATDYGRAKVALEKLKTAPADPAANLAAGRYYCLARGDFALGLPMLAKGSDAALKTLAAGDLANPTLPPAQQAIGDLWWDQAAREAKSPAAADLCNLRAAHWYRLAEPNLAGLAKLAIQQRLAKVPGSADTAPASALEKDLTDKLNDLNAWDIKRGKWTMQGPRLRGEGDTEMEFKTPLPADCVLSFHMDVVSGMRPRVHLHGTGIMFGNEGYSKQLYPHGGTVSEGKAFPYENGQEEAITLRFAGDHFEVEINGKRAFTGTRKVSDSIHLALWAGDGWSRGTTEFWDFKLETPSPTPSPKAGHP